MELGPDAVSELAPLERIAGVGATAVVGEASLEVDVINVYFALDQRCSLAEEDEEVEHQEAKLGSGGA